MISAIKLFFGGLPLANIKKYALIGAIIFSAVMYLLWQSEKSSHKLTVSEYARLSAENKAKTAIEKQQREKITADVVNSYADSIEKVKQYYVQNPTIKHRTIRVRDNSCDGMPTERESTSRVDTDTNGIDEAIATELAAEVQIDFEKASKEIVQCLELIKFNKEQDAVE